MSLLGVAAPASAAGWDGTPGYFSGNGTAEDGYGGPALEANDGGTLQYADEVYPKSPLSRSFLLDGATSLSDPDTTVGELGSGDFAIGVHFKTSTGAANIALLSKESEPNYTSPKSGQFWEVDLAEGAVYVEMQGPTSSVAFGQGNVNLVDGNWHYAAVIRSGDVVYIYIDGALEAQHAYTGANPANASDDQARLRLGSNPCSRSTNLTGNIADAYVGPGSLYTLTVDDSDPTVQPGTSGGPTLNYHNDRFGLMRTDVTAPTDTRLSNLTGPGCDTETAHCEWPLTGNGAPITAAVAVPAAPGETFSGGNFSMADLRFPISPSSTGWDSSNDTANVAFSVTAAEAPPVPMVDLKVAGAALVGLVTAGAAVATTRRRSWSRAG